ncbi:MAG: hypothetical protein H0U75_12475 [Legionella sp.]|nr:hypothetical protein [Legionella sp.]
MHKYHFKGFYLSYDITYSPLFKYYEAKGEVNRIEDKKITFKKVFGTEVATSRAAIGEIKRLMEAFIDSNWHQYKLLKVERPKYNIHDS